VVLIVRRSCGQVGHIRSQYTVDVTVRTHDENFHGARGFGVAVAAVENGIITIWN